MSASFDFAGAAHNIMARFATENTVRLEKNKVLKTFADRMTASAMAGYAETAIVIAGLMKAGAWTTRRQSGGAKSASVLLKAALVAECAARELNEARVKRLVERASAILTGKKSIPGVLDAANSGSVDGIIAALATAKIKNEKALAVHCEGKPENDPVKRILAMIENLDSDQRARLDAAMSEDEPETAPARVPARGAGKPAPSVAVHSAA